MNQPKTTTESANPAPFSASVPVPADKPKPPRRRFTPEERIANREAEIARIKEGRRTKARELIDDAREMLRQCRAEAKASGMEVEAQRCEDALDVLAGTKKIEDK